MDNPLRGLAQIGIILLGAAIAAVIGYGLFVEIPESTAELLGIVLALLVVGVGVKLAGNAVESLFPGYNVAEVAVEGPITRDGGGGPLPTQPGSTPADDIVEQIEQADADENVEALMIRLNTPGGEVVPSDDIRLAAEEFDGPTIAYAQDTCASGGYWIASGCDELWARDMSIVGSIGVIGSRVNASELADKVGISYERLAAGEYKDAGIPLKELEEDEREYLQNLIDDLYGNFVERVAAGRDLDEETIRDTEARIYLGEDAIELGLVDELGTAEDVKDALIERIEGDSIDVREFEPDRGLQARLRGGAASVAYSFGAGVASVVGDDGEVDIQLR
ncbi:signal peptide peptidase SppA [Natranaeroarchaeum sulfidigenes]|uniref:Periplasmic serine protease (ClpP class) n=1 Tax=Natranaeroarchaeum sulfidigenes TaxID=2784880 RepID=A0A897MSS3_9EURY|nr:Periplasmic serine protease (ClpP class) [Natranaeroarchaeum sulfidigenes]